MKPIPRALFHVLSLSCPPSRPPPHSPGYCFRRFSNRNQQRRQLSEPTRTQTLLQLQVKGNDVHIKSLSEQQDIRDGSEVVVGCSGDKINLMANGSTPFPGITNKCQAGAPTSGRRGLGLRLLNYLLEP